MKKQYRKKKNNIHHFSLLIGVSFCFVFLFVFFFFAWFSKVATPKFIHLSQLQMEQYITHVASDFKLLIEKNYSDEFLEITENNQGEITSIHYNMPKIYEMADQFTNTLEINMYDYRELYEYDYNQMKHPDGILLMYPLGILSNSVFLSNLGPKIPVLMKFVGSVFSNVKTRAKDYGINNALLEVTITYEILTPITMEENQFTYELLLDSKVIQGSVPNFYGGSMETRSSFFDISFPTIL